MDARLQFAGRTEARIEIAEPPGISNQQVEAGILASPALDVMQVLQRRLAAAQESGDQFATGTPSEWLARVADIGQRGEAPAGSDAQPGAAGFQVASCVDVRSLFPGRQRQGGAGIEFIAVGRYHQRHGMPGAPGENDQAHSGLLGLA
ncbi:hypothetical protein D3C81_1413080 [compost metagenome]